MAIGMLGTGVTGLLASQKALSTASQNIANVNTEGYSRQRVNLSTHTPYPYGPAFVGTGVKITGIERVYDQFLVDQVRTGSSSLNQLSEFYSLASQVDNILADPQAGLTPGLQSFFNAAQDLANDPSSASARQVMLSEAETLSNRFHYLDQRIDDIDNAVNSDISNIVSEINGITASIANVNKQIGELRSQGGGEPNDVLDQRDILIKSLAEKIGVTTVYQDDGSVNVFIGNGQAVVAGHQSRDLSVLKNDYDPSIASIGYDLGSSVVNITSQLSGGKLGGFLQYRSELSESMKNSMGLLAAGLSSTFNNQHRNGLDLNGDIGGDFFTDLSTLTPKVLASRSNTSASPANISANIIDIDSLTTSNYTLKRTGSVYTLTRELDNFVHTFTGFPSTSETVDGVNYTLNSGSLADGDRFQIKPVNTGAADINVAITDPAKIAAASPIRASVGIDNSGSATIESYNVSDSSSYTADTYTIAIVTPTTYEVRDSSSVLVATGAYSNGADISFNGVDISIAGKVDTGDLFTVVPNTNGIGDNTNMLSLAGLRLENTLKNGTVTYQGLYGQMVVDVGTKTRQAEVNSMAQEGLLNQAIAAREEKSGVNLDEEAADLIKYQQLYQAAAQIISVADTTFQSLIGILRR